jgi:hypothetical protein
MSYHTVKENKKSYQSSILQNTNLLIHSLINRKTEETQYEKTDYNQKLFIHCNIYLI